MQEARGCFKPAPIPVFVLDDERYFRCPLKVITRETAEMLRYFKFYQNGYLPVSGGLLDQSAKFVSAIEVIGAEINNDR